MNSRVDQLASSLNRRAAMVAVWVLVALAAMPAAPASAAPAGRLVVSGLTIEPGSVSFVVTAADLTAGASLDPAKVRVRVGSTALTVESRTAPDAKGVPARGLQIVVDTSFRMAAEDFAATTEAARRFGAALPPDVRLGLVTTSPPTVALDPTADRGAYTKALDGLRRGGDGAVFDAVLLAAESLRTHGLGADTDRRLVVFANGTDVVSGAQPSVVGDRLARAHLAVDAVALERGGAVSDLDLVATATGGRMLPAADPTELTASVAAAAAAFSVPVAVTAQVPNELAAKTTTMEVTVEGNGLTATTPVTFGPAVLSAASAGPGGYGWVPGWLGYVLVLAVFLAVVVVVLALAWPRSAKLARMKQIELFGPGRAPTPKPEPGSPTGVIARTALAATATVVGSGGMEERITRRLERAGMRLKATEWVLLRACVMVTVASVLYVVAGVTGIVLGLVIGWLATLLYQSFRVDRRANLFAEQLPDALQLVIGSLKASFSLPQSLDALVREAPEPVASEFGRAVTEHKLGADVSDALERLAQRTESDDLAWAVMAVRIQREVGGNLAEVLQTTVDTMRERSRLRRHVRALSAEGRLSAWVLIVLPVALAGFMFFFRRDYLAPLANTFEGIVMVVGGVLLFMVGVFWMTRVIKVEA